MHKVVEKWISEIRNLKGKWNLGELAETGNGVLAFCVDLREVYEFGSKNAESRGNSEGSEASKGKRAR